MSNLYPQVLQDMVEVYERSEKHDKTIAVMLAQMLLDLGFPGHAEHFLERSDGRRYVASGYSEHHRYRCIPGSGCCVIIAVRKGQWPVMVVYANEPFDFPPDKKKP